MRDKSGDEEILRICNTIATVPPPRLLATAACRAVHCVTQHSIVHPANNLRAPAQHRPSIVYIMKYSLDPMSPRTVGRHHTLVHETRKIIRNALEAAHRTRNQPSLTQIRLFSPTPTRLSESRRPSAYRDAYGAAARTPTKDATAKRTRLSSFI